MGEISRFALEPENERNPKFVVEPGTGEFFSDVWTASQGHQTLL
jgi:hypothetical protein